LTLTLSSTRLILTNGHTGTHAAGDIIEAFGTLLMGGNFVIGIVVFVILAIVSLVVVNKGSGRIAEVAARFSLDAMPGKQMAIDADLSAGLIDETEARRRRRDLEDESAFYGAMDGASKFVKGDAIAGLLIVVINIVGGLIIGVLQHDLSFADAAQTYTVLTVGDGLVAAIPSILVSVGAGMLVSKAGVGAPAGEALSEQLSASPKALATVAALLVGLGLTPGMPLLPFFGLAVLLGGLAWQLPKQRAAQQARDREASERQEKEKAGTPAQHLAADLRFDPVRVELGIAVSSAVMTGGDSLSQRVMELRRQLARRYGFVLPTVEIRPNPTLSPNAYVLHLRNIEIARGDLMPGRFLVMNPTGAPLDIPGQDTREPAFGLPARWIEANLREEAEIRGYAVVDPATVVTVHLTEVVKENMAELLDYAATQKLLNEIGSEHQKLVSDLVPNVLSMSIVQRVLQSLLAEQVSIRDLPVILDALAEAAAFTRPACASGSLVRSASRWPPRTAMSISSRCRRNGSGFSPNRSWSKATTASWRWRPARSSASSARSARPCRRKPRPAARRRCWSAPRSARWFAPSSPASAPRRRSSAMTRSIRRPASGRWARSPLRHSTPDPRTDRGPRRATNPIRR
jgi:flagellar biosynthesis protein FlhA